MADNQGVYEYLETEPVGGTFSGFLNKLGNSIRSSHQWTAYTPTVTMTGGSFAQGSTGSRVGYYRRIGNVLEVKAYVAGGGTGFAISGSVMNFGLPSGFSTDGTLGEQFLNMKIYSPAAGGNWAGYAQFTANATSGSLQSPGTSAVSAMTPVDAGRFQSGANLSIWGTIKIG
jgi:hypothetical protein